VWRWRPWLLVMVVVVEVSQDGGAWVSDAATQGPTQADRDSDTWAPIVAGRAGESERDVRLGGRFSQSRCTPAGAGVVNQRQRA